MGEPLYQDVVTALANAGMNDVKVIGGRYGLGSKDTPPASVFAVYDELSKDEMKRQFTIGIVDDVTNLSLPEDKNCPNTAAPGTIECKFWGLGGDGTVGANKNSIKIIGDHTDKYVQAYFQYDSKKTGGVTISHLRFGDHPIRSPYYINKADFVACHNPSYVTKGFKMVQDVKPGGVYMINCQWDFDELNHHMDAASKRYIARNNIQLYTINAIDLAIEIGMGKRNNTILQSAFFSLAKVMPEEDAIRYMKEKAKASYLKKGQDVVDMNYKAIDLGATAYKKVDVPADWADAVDTRGAQAARRVSRSWSRWSRRSSIPSARWTATACPSAPSSTMWTASSSSAPLPMRSAAWPSPSRRGMPRSASSATSALTAARTPPSVPMP